MQNSSYPLLSLLNEYQPYTIPSTSCLSETNAESTSDCMEDEEPWLLDGYCQPETTPSSTVVMEDLPDSTPSKSSYMPPSPIEIQAVYNLGHEINMLENRAKYLENQNEQQQKYINHLLQVLLETNNKQTQQINTIPVPTPTPRREYRLERSDSMGMDSSPSSSPTSLQFVNHEGSEINSWIEKYHASKLRQPRRKTSRSLKQQMDELE